MIQHNLSYLIFARIKTLKADLSVKTNATLDVPEITESCWSILDVNPDDMMCATSRMIVKRKGALEPMVLPCTLLPYDTAFDLGNTLKDADKTIKLNHPHCAKFCVLGGGSCSVSCK